MPLTSILLIAFALLLLPVGIHQMIAWSVDSSALRYAWRRQRISVKNGLFLMSSAGLGLTSVLWHFSWQISGAVLLVATCAAVLSVAAALLLGLVWEEVNELFLTFVAGRYAEKNVDLTNLATATRRRRRSRAGSRKIAGHQPRDGGGFSHPKQPIGYRHNRQPR